MTSLNNQTKTKLLITKLKKFTFKTLIFPPPIGKPCSIKVFLFDLTIEKNKICWKSKIQDKFTLFGLAF